MKDIINFINEGRETQYEIPVKELYKIAVERGIEQRESYDKNWKDDTRLGKPTSLDKTSIKGCACIRCEILGDYMKEHSGKHDEIRKNNLEYAKKIKDIFDKYWNETIIINRTYTTSYYTKFYEYECIFDKNIIINIEYMGNLEKLNEYKLKIKRNT